MMWNSTFCKLVFSPWYSDIPNRVNQHGLEYHYNKGKNVFTKKLYSISSHIFHITRETEDEHTPVLVSAHPLPKIRQKIPFTKI